MPLLPGLSSLPGDHFAVAEELAVRAIVGEGCQPDGCVGPLLGGSGSGGAAHVRPDPAGAHRVDQNPRPAQLARQDAGVQVEDDLGSVDQDSALFAVL